MNIFLSTPSARRATGRHPRLYRSTAISIHALREEGDRRTTAVCSRRALFLSTPSARRATILPKFYVFVSDISIHALREEGDHAGSVQGADCANISIHALREEGDVVVVVIGSVEMLFLSTPSARRATRDRKLYGRRDQGFLSTPSARRATSPRWFSEGDGCISIHALREEGDRVHSRQLPCTC